jgi:hypothetical protein
MITLTPFDFAKATVSSSMSRLLVMTSARMPSSMALRCTSFRSPTMMIDWLAGIFSRSEMLQNERMSIVPSRTKRSSTFFSSTRCNGRPRSARAMLASEV